jgi:hypothetical protein
MQIGESRFSAIEIDNLDLQFDRRQDGRMAERLKLLRHGASRSSAKPLL